MPASGEESQTVSNTPRFFSSFYLINVNFHLVKCQAPSNIHPEFGTGNLPIAASPSDRHLCPSVTIRALNGPTLSCKCLKAMLPSVCSIEHKSQNEVIGERRGFSVVPSIHTFIFFGSSLPLVNHGMKMLNVNFKK